MISTVLPVKGSLILDDSHLTPQNGIPIFSLFFGIPLVLDK